ncbi:MAG: flippase [Campylobacterota bacterium]|nr:flippase [Campylobacterota bacterium]
MKSLTKFFLNNKEFSKYFKNTSWMLVEKVYKLGTILFINILIARYLGPEQFGYLAYVISLVALFAVTTHMGLSALVVKELVSTPAKSGEVLATVFYIKLLGAVLGFSILIAINLLTEELFSLNFLVLLIISLSIFFKPFEVIDFWFIANVQAKYTAIVNTISLMITSLFQVVFVLISMSLVWFSLANFLQSFLVAIIFIYFFYKKIKLSASKLNFSLEKAKYLLSKSWMIMLGGLFAIIYLKIDQIMLKWMIGNESVGVYAIASSLSEVWYFLPTIIVTSLFPKIIEMKNSFSVNYHQRLQQLFDLLFVIAFVLAILVSIFANDVILFLYGQEYALAGQILSIHIWAGVFIFMRALFSKWIIIEDMLMFSLITQGFGALTNIILNFILIPKYGAYGAAFATLFSYAIASYVVLVFYTKTREVFWMMSKAIISPIRYPILLIKAKVNG